MRHDAEHEAELRLGHGRQPREEAGDRPAPAAGGEERGEER